jgi:hypothetical protein
MSALGADSVQAAPGGNTASNTYIPVSEKATPSGVATLDAYAKIIPAQLPDLSATYGKAVNLEMYPGVDATGNTDSTTAIQAAINAASTKGVPLVSSAAHYTISSTIYLRDHADLSRAVFNYRGTTGVAIVVGASVGSITRKRIHTPYLIALAKTVAGWAQVAGTIGVQVVNTSDCDVTLGTIRNCDIGAQFTGRGARGGVTYSRFHLGTFLNNRVNMNITAVDGGYANQCQAYGGTFNYDAAEGTNVYGTRHVLIDSIPAAVDGWTFHELSMEDSGGVCEYTIDCAGNNNVFDQCRFERAPGFTPKIAWRDGSHDNEIRGGVNVDAIVEDVFGATRNRITRHPGMLTLAASKTVGPSEFGKTIISNAPGAVHYTLPDVSYISPGTRVTIKNVAASTLIIVTAADPIDGSFAAIPITQWASASFVSQQIPDHRWLRL